MEYLWIFGGAIIVMSLVWIAAANTTEAKAAKAKERAALSEYERVGLRIGRPLLRGAVISGDHAGLRFEHYIVPAAKNTPARTVVSVPSTTPGELHVGPENFVSESVKQLGMVNEFHTGDDSFDRKYYFSGSTDEYVKSVFGVRENLERLRILFAAGFDELEKSGTQLMASRSGAAWLGVAELEGTVEQLAKFNLPPVASGVEAPKLGGKQTLYVMRGAALISLIVGLAGFNLVRPLLDGWIAFALGVLPILAVLCVAILAAAYLGLKGRSMAARGMIELLAALPALALSLVGTLALANEWLDRMKAEEHEVRLLKRYETSGRKNSHYHVEFESWRGRNREELTVPAGTYALAREGEVWRLRTRRGWLGHPWIESIAPRT